MSTSKKLLAFSKRTDVQVVSAYLLIGAGVWLGTSYQALATFKATGALPSSQPSVLGAILGWPFLANR